MKTKWSDRLATMISHAIDFFGHPLMVVFTLLLTVTMWTWGWWSENDELITRLDNIATFSTYPLFFMILCAGQRTERLIKIWVKEAVRGIDGARDEVTELEDAPETEIRKVEQEQRDNPKPPQPKRKSPPRKK